MTPERGHAYTRVMVTLTQLGPSKLLPREQDRIRDAADTLLFANTIDDARHALVDTGLLTDHLLTSTRWTETMVDKLVTDLLACGPSNIPAHA